MEETYAVGGLDNEFTGTNPGVVFDSDILGNLQDVAAERELTEIKTQLSGAVAAAPCPLMIEIAYGTSPTTGILAYADSNECDVIVMGCRGLGALRGMIGSVSFAVLRSATVPVLIVK
jgi:nucleotide-binding universal stress UspA family protein